MKLASIEEILEVKAHPNADRLDLVKILGYQLVTQKGLYKDGDLVIYVPTDTLLPIEKWTEDYRKYSPKRIKAVKLRNEWSEGIIIPFELIRHKFDQESAIYYEGFDSTLIGCDVAKEIGITKYEPPLPQDLNAKSSILPHSIPKTDEERAESILNKLPFGELVDVSLKIDGSSTTYYYKLDSDEFGITSRSQELYSMFTNNFTIHNKTFNIETKLREFCQKNGVSIALRGESYGQGIQVDEHNPSSKMPKSFVLFDVYLIDERRYARKGDKYYYADIDLDIPKVPMVEKDVILTQELIQKYSIKLKTVWNQPFEGVVVKTSTGSFKIINKHYDSKK